jgi:hypothetical protein
VQAWWIFDSARLARATGRERVQAKGHVRLFGNGPHISAVHAIVDVHGQCGIPSATVLSKAKAPPRCLPV